MFVYMSESAITTAVSADKWPTYRGACAFVTKTKRESYVSTEMADYVADKTNASSDRAIP